MQISKYKKRNLVLRFPLLLQMYFKREKKRKQKKQHDTWTFLSFCKCFCKRKERKKETRYPLFSWKFFLKKKRPNTLASSILSRKSSQRPVHCTCCTRLVHLSNLLYKAWTLIQRSRRPDFAADRAIFTSNPLLISTRSPELKNQHCVAMFWGHNEQNLFLFLFWCFKLHSMQYTVHYNVWELVIESCPTVIWILLNMQSKVQYGWSLYYRCHFALKTHSETLFGVNDRLPDVSLGTLKRCKHEVTYTQW